jgi:hypothetical protein
MQIDLSKQDAALIQYALAVSVSDFKKGIRETKIPETQTAYAEAIERLRELQARIERAQ